MLSHLFELIREPNPTIKTIAADSINVLVEVVHLNT